MYRRLSFLLFCFISILFSSCINTLEEEGIYETTRFYGVVLDNRTNQPLQGLRVIGWDGQNTGKVVYTAVDGTFEMVVTMDQLVKGYSILFTADSLYESLDYSLADVPIGMKEYNIGVLYMVGPEVPIVEMGRIVDITATSARCYGSILSWGNSTILEQGIVYSTMQYPTIDNDKVTVPVGQDDFDCTLTLSPHTTYYARVYAVNGIGVGYSDQVTITTRDGLASVYTASVTNITTTSASCGGEVVVDGGFNVLSRGICWSTSAQPTISNAHTVNGSGLGVFTSQMDNLEPNTTYHVRSYAQNSSGIAYGPERTFVTQSGLPTVTTTTATNITATSAVAGGAVATDGGYPVIRRGVCYGTTSQPTVSGLHTTDGAGTGTFVSQLTGLTPGTTYYYRAYATNGVGTVYGEQKIFVAW
jgi:hypothetical protein